MIVHVDEGFRLRLDEPDSFKAFKLQMERPVSDLPLARAGLAPQVHFGSDSDAWVAVDALQKVSGRSQDPVWQAGFSAMLKAAAPHGWVSEDGLAIRAHVQWAKPQG